MEKSLKEIFKEHKKSQLEKEKLLLSSHAAFSKNHSRLYPEESDHRLPYTRDVDRIIYSKAYSRYVDKTQVIYLVENDHITHRALHVQLVSNFARSLAEILQLNASLTEAISLGHDVGHPPFGHEGESYLSILSVKSGNGSFDHAWQSCRLFREIEPLNLALTVYDGFLCHDGGLQDRELSPKRNKTWDDHFQELQDKITNRKKQFIPMTLEGCLVKICDTICYTGRDIEDAIRINILKREDIPKTCLGSTNSEILSTLTLDIINESYKKDKIALSQKAFDALKELRNFNFKNIYLHPKIKSESKKIRTSYKHLFDALLQDLIEKKEHGFVWNNFLHNKCNEYLETAEEKQMVIDYIAGMTDQFFLRTYNQLLVPKKN